MRSRCFTWFPISDLGEPNYTIIWLNLQECGDFTWRMSETEELFLSSAGIEQLSHCFDLNSQNHY